MMVIIYQLNLKLQSVLHKYVIRLETLKMHYLLTYTKHVNRECRQLLIASIQDYFSSFTLGIIPTPIARLDIIARLDTDSFSISFTCGGACS